MNYCRTLLIALSVSLQASFSLSAEDQIGKWNTIVVAFRDAMSPEVKAIPDRQVRKKAAREAFTLALKAWTAEDLLRAAREACTEASAAGSLDEGIPRAFYAVQISLELYPEKAASEGGVKELISIVQDKTSPPLLRLALVSALDGESFSFSKFMQRQISVQQIDAAKVLSSIHNDAAELAQVRVAAFRSAFALLRNRYYAVIRVDPAVSKMAEGAGRAPSLKEISLQNIKLERKTLDALEALDREAIELGSGLAASAGTLSDNQARRSIVGLVGNFVSGGIPFNRNEDLQAKFLQVTETNK